MSAIITDLNQLATPSEPLEFLTEAGPDTAEGAEIIASIKSVMAADENILALSAPQIGINKRIFCLRFSDQIKTFINPIITKKNGISIVIETCASMPGKEIVIGRPEEITIVYYNEDFKYEDNKLLGVAASLFDQQAQILDGVLPTELGLVSDIEIDGKIEDTDLEEIVPFYKNTFLPSKLAAVDAAIANDPDAAAAYKHLKFTENVINGRITVVESEEEALKRNRAKKAAKASMTSFLRAENEAKKAKFNAFVKNISKKRH